MKHTCSEYIDMFHRIGSIKAYIVFSEVGQTKINNEDTFQLFRHVLSIFLSYF